MASTDALLAGDLDAFRRECALLVREAPIHEAVRAFDADALRATLPSYEARPIVRPERWLGPRDAAALVVAAW